MVRDGRISKQPSPYGSSLLFHGLRVVQVISSVIVTSFFGFLYQTFGSGDVLCAVDVYTASLRFRLYSCILHNNKRSTFQPHPQAEDQRNDQWLPEHTLDAGLRAVDMESKYHIDTSMFYCELVYTSGRVGL